jgi:Resolvase, N terminal domain
VVRKSVDAQVKQLHATGCEKVFRETASGARSDRVGLRRALDQLGMGDVLMETHLDRLARSKFTTGRRPEKKPSTSRPQKKPPPNRAIASCGECPLWQATGGRSLRDDAILHGKFVVDENQVWIRQLRMPSLAVVLTLGQDGLNPEHRSKLSCREDRQLLVHSLSQKTCA